MQRGITMAMVFKENALPEDTQRGMTNPEPEELTQLGGRRDDGLTLRRLHPPFVLGLVLQMRS
jgi:hypothetical protein